MPAGPYLTSLLKHALEMQSEIEPLSLPRGKQPTLRIVPMPADTNYAGSIFGGWILSHVDIAGSIAAIQRAQGRVVTVAINSVEFHEPVFVGDVVSCYAEVIGVGRTSITVKVDVYAERNPERVQVLKVTQAVLVYVALDKDLRPRVVPPEEEAVPNE
jgi:acyl-CoA thioesterase YciA